MVGSQLSELFDGIASSDGKSVWWGNGLAFECLGCGRCCRGASGGIFVTLSEEAKIAEFLNLTIVTFRYQYETDRWRFRSIKENREGFCIFLNCENHCEIYPVRPTSCRTWPFWPQVLFSPSSWSNCAAECIGMNNGSLCDRRQIYAILEEQIRHQRTLESELKLQLAGKNVPF